MYCHLFNTLIDTFVIYVYSQHYLLYIYVCSLVGDYYNLADFYNKDTMKTKTMKKY